MRVLLTNHQLLDFGGSELYTLTLADHLRRAGHEVTAYSRYVDRLRPHFEAAGVTVIQDLREVEDLAFDVAHVHHNVSAAEVRHHFPTLPMVFVSHGLPFLEQPPFLDLGVSRFAAVSEAGRVRLHGLGAAGDIAIARNPIDTGLFAPAAPIAKRPTRALALSSMMTPRKGQVILDACRPLGILCRFVGGSRERVEPREIAALINEVDIVFALGRGAVEAMFCGRIPIVFDQPYSDGIVTPANFREVMTDNFSGRRYRRRLSAGALADEIRAYRVRYAESLRGLALEHFEAGARTREMLTLYAAVAAEPVMPLPTVTRRALAAFVESVRETRQWTYADRTASAEHIEAALRTAEREIVRLVTTVAARDAEVERLQMHVGLRDTRIAHLEHTIEALAAEAVRLRQHASLPGRLHAAAAHLAVRVHRKPMRPEGRQ